MNAGELKRLLIEAWFGMQQSVADQAIDQWQVCFNAYLKTKGNTILTCLLKFVL